MVLNGWHSGERAIHAKLNYTDVNDGTFQIIDDYLPSQHRLFYRENLPFVPIATLDDQGRVWGSFAFQKSGKRGFMCSPSSEILELELDVNRADPLFPVLERSRARNTQSGPGGRELIAGVGVDMSNRRRNKFAGSIERVEGSGEHFDVVLHVNQALGNCPKYITIRELVPHPSYTPRVLQRRLQLGANDRLPGEAIRILQSAETIFVGTYYNASSTEAVKYPSHLGMNHRGGQKGWVRVRQDGRSVVVPDYSGNRLMTSLGNIQATSLASISVADFDTGSVLHLTGTARNLIGEDARAIQPRSELITVVEVTGFVAIADALPLRQKAGSVPTPSPYNPPIRYLAEEDSFTETSYKSTSLVLSSIQMLSPSIASLTFAVSQAILVQPGQYAIIDCSSILGRKAYRHIANDGMEASLNDDGLRTWTVSSYHASEDRCITITMREKQGGAVTGRLFQIASKLKEMRPDLLQDSTPLGLTLQLIGIGGEFEYSDNASRILMLAGGIGVTPFLSMLSSMVQQRNRQRDVILLLSTRDTGLMSRLVKDAIGQVSPEHLKFRLVIFTSAKETSPLDSTDVEILPERIGTAFLRNIGDVQQRDVLACGPLDWERAVMRSLDEVGIPVGKVKREGFTF